MCLYMKPGTLMKTVQLVDRLTEIRLFADLPRDKVDEIVRRVSGCVRRYDKTAVIVHESVEPKWMFAVLSGVVSIYEPGENGDRHLIRTVEGGHLFGATLVTMRLAFYPGMAVAATDCEVARFDLAKIRELWYDMRYRKFFENLYAVVSEYVFYCWRKFSVMACKTTEEKFMRYLNLYARASGSKDMTLPFSRMEDCAVFLGVSRASLSPAIGRLEAQGRLKHLGRAHFVLL